MPASADVKIHALSLEQLEMFAPLVAPLLRQGFEAANIDPLEALGDIANCLMQTWIVVVEKPDDIDVLAAFVTSVGECPTRGDVFVDVCGLAGRNILTWGPKLSDTMVEFARLNGATRVCFQGRKGLARAYRDVRVMGQINDNTFCFERAVA